MRYGEARGVFMFWGVPPRKCGAKRPVVIDGEE